MGSSPRSRTPMCPCARVSRLEGTAEVTTASGARDARCAWTSLKGTTEHDHSMVRLNNARSVRAPSDSRCGLPRETRSVNRKVVKLNLDMNTLKKELNLEFSSRTIRRRHFYKPIREIAFVPRPKAIVPETFHILFPLNLKQHVFFG